MRTRLTPGQSVTARVPATSANLGPGFDCLGMSLSWYDDVSVTVTDSDYRAEVTGEGADVIPTDRSHLVIATILEALQSLDVHAPGLLLRADNTIPHGRGLGSSSAALVSGLLLAWGLAHPGEEPDRRWLLSEAVKREGHADNVAPAILGGFVITWAPMDNEIEHSHVRARSSAIHDSIRALALVPTFELATSKARGILPTEIPLSSAVSNTSRAALLVHAVSEEPALLHAATADTLHQDRRGPLMPQSYELMRQLRALGYGAFISGAGPTVLVLVSADEVEALTQQVPALNPDGVFTSHLLTPGVGAQLINN